MIEILITFLNMNKVSRYMYMYTKAYLKITTTC